MQLSKLVGRLAFIFQWPLALLLPWFSFFESELLGRGSMGMASLGAGAVASIAIPLLLVTALLTLFDRAVRSSQRTRRAYTAAVLVLWVLMAIFPFVIGYSSEIPEDLPRLTAWTGGVFPTELAEVVQSVCVGGSVLAWVVATGLAIAGIIVSHRQVAVPPTP
ncbi:hypothetical protein GCM10027421_09530 [Microbacterium shaanxiense]